MSNIIEKLFVSIGFKTDEESKNKVASDASALKGTLTKILGAVGVSLSVAGIMNYTKAAINAASETEQMEEKFNAVFLDLSDAADKWADNLSVSIGRSKNSIKTYLADQQNLLVGFGMARDEAASMSEEMVEAAINIASFNNIADDDAINAMSKALMGETECAKRLGAVLNDNTIAMAMEDLGYKQKFKDLDEATKMQVRYHSIVMQSPDAFREENGVVGDAALSMNTYESQLRAFNATMKDIKDNIGTFLLPFAREVLGMVRSGANYLRDMTKGLGDANQEGTKASKLLQSFTKFMNTAKDVAKKAVDIARKLIDAFGGAENALQILTVAIGALIALRSTEKIYNFLNAAKGIAGILGSINIKLLGAIALITALFLVVDDFIGFMNGKDSVFGDLIEAAGGDQDEVRNTLNRLKDDVESVFNDIKDDLAPVFDDIKEFWDDYGPEIKDGIKEIAEYFEKMQGQSILNLVDQLKDMAEALKDIRDVIQAFKEGGISGAVGKIKEKVADAGGVKNVAKEGARSALKSQLNPFDPGSKYLSSGIDTLLDDSLPKGASWIGKVGQGISDGVGTVKDAVSGVMEKAQSVIDDSGSQKYWDGLDAVRNYARGMRDGEAEVTAQAWSLADSISSLMHHSTPDEGPLAGDDKWMPDMMDNFISGIEEKKEAIRRSMETVAAAMRTAAPGMNELMGGGSGRIASGGISRTSSIIQNISFSNTFNGDTRGNQVAASKQMRSNANDTSSYLANALALGR